MKLMEGKPVADAVLGQLQQMTATLKRQGLQPGLAVVLVGEDPASQVYVNMKARKSEELGLYSVKKVLPADATLEQVLAQVAELNADDRIDGILVQSPPPPHIDERVVIEAISPAKDVDCFHPYSVGKLMIGDDDGFLPCTPYGCMLLLQYYGIETSGKHAVVIGRSNIVGKPMAALLGRKSKHANCTVTMCHSRTQNMSEITRQADILIAAIGKPEFVTAEMVKEGAVVIDVGINRVDDPSAKRGYRLTGDVAFDEVKEKVSWITPVPGGVGPMTIAMLMANAVKACCRRNGITFDLTF